MSESSSVSQRPGRLRSACTRPWSRAAPRTRCRLLPVTRYWANPGPTRHHRYWLSTFSAPHFDSESGVRTIRGRVRIRELQRLEDAAGRRGRGRISSPGPGAHRASTSIAGQGRRADVGRPLRGTSAESAPGLSLESSRLRVLVRPCVVRSRQLGLQGSAPTLAASRRPRLLLHRPSCRSSLLESPRFRLS